MNGSRFGQLSAVDWKKIAKGAAIAAAGALLGYLADTAIPQMESAGAVTAAAIASVLLNGARKLLTDTTSRPHKFLI